MRRRKKLEFIYLDKGIVNVIQVKPSENDKIGFGMVIQTYHFALEQIEEYNLKLDSKTCLDCPLSFNSGSDGCYTHKGTQYMGLLSMIRRLKKLTFSKFSAKSWKEFIKLCPDVSLVRFGAYGEPIHMSLGIVADLVKKSRKWTGYTHQWNKPQYKMYSSYFMASVHSVFEQRIANDMGFRTFSTGDESENSISCPASKEEGYKLTCIQCALCSGASKDTKNIKIKKH